MLCKGFPGHSNSNSDGKAQNKTRAERKLGDGAKFIVPAMYPSVCVCVCVTVLCCQPTLLSFVVVVLALLVVIQSISAFVCQEKLPRCFDFFAPLCAAFAALVALLLLLLLLLCFYYWPPYFYGAEATAQLPVALFKHDVYVICSRSPATTIY